MLAWGGGLPSIVGESYRALGGAGDELYRGNTEGAEAHLGVLDRNGAALGKLRGDIFGKLKREMDRGRGGGQYEQMERDADRRLRTMARGAYLSMSPGQRGNFATASGLGLGGSVGLGFGGGQTAARFSEGALSSEAVMAVQGGGVGAAPRYSPDSMGGDFSQGPVHPPLDEKKKLKRFKDNVSDVVDKPGVSIWTIITHRYRESAFPRVLEPEEEGTLDG